jgi:DNA invertase Pin-like site-specific DNA recombinase
MKKAAIYARFSTDLQNERSIEDQIALCRNYTAREGMTSPKSTRTEHVPAAQSWGATACCTSWTEQEIDRLR